MGNLRNRLLKILLVLLALSAALFGGCILYLAITDPIKQPYRQYFYPILLAICLSAVPFFTGLFYGYRFLRQTDSTPQETGTVVQTLRKIKICAISYGILFLLVIPFWLGLAEANDAPGAMFFGLLPICWGPVLLLVIQIQKQTAENQCIKKYSWNPHKGFQLFLFFFSNNPPCPTKQKTAALFKEFFGNFILSFQSFCHGQDFFFHTFCHLLQIRSFLSINAFLQINHRLHHKNGAFIKSFQHFSIFFMEEIMDTAMVQVTSAFMNCPLDVLFCDFMPKVIQTAS